MRLRVRGDIKTADIVDATKEFRSSLSGRLPTVAVDETDINLFQAFSGNGKNVRSQTRVKIYHSVTLYSVLIDATNKHSEQQKTTRRHITVSTYTHTSGLSVTVVKISK